MKEALRQTEIDTPYFSGGPLILAAGRKYNTKLGGNCVYQNTQLAEKLRKKGYPVRFIGTQRERLHVATLCQGDDGLYMLDPFLLHKDPINLTRLFKERARLIVETHAIREGLPEVLVVEATGKSKLKIEHHAAADQSDPIMRYYYDLEHDTKDSLPQMNDPEIAKVRQNAITLRTFSGNDGTITKTSLSTQTGLITFREFGAEEKLYRQRTDPAKIKEVLQNISRQLRISLSEVLRDLYEAMAIYQR